MAGGLTNGPGRVGEDAVHGGGQQALGIEVRLVVLTIVIISHYIISDDIVNRKRLLTACGLAGDDDRIGVHAVGGEDRRIHQRVRVLQGQVVAQVRVQVQEPGDAGVQGVPVRQDVNLHILGHGGEIVLGGVGDVVDAAVRQVELGPLLRQLTHQQVEHDDGGHGQSRDTGGESAPAGAVPSGGGFQRFFNLHVSRPPFSSTGASGPPGR